MQVVLESLERAQIRLRDEIPQVSLLWNDTVDGKITHKDENTLSHWIADHLNQDLARRGVVVNREVKIRPSRGEASGEITDIHVVAISPLKNGQSETMRVIIETKGCWHPQLKTAMKTQLVERYLKDNSCQHGIYLVGWYHCAQWEPKNDAAKENLKNSLEKQAKDLSTAGLAIKPMLLDVSLR
jgi:hypothetical protein